VAQYGQYTKWGALALFVIITIMAQKWGIGGALASFLALAVFAALYAMDETAGIRAAELQKQKEDEERKKAAEEAQKKEDQKKGVGPSGAISDRSGNVELKAAIFDRAVDEKKLFQAAHDGNFDEVNRLIENGTAVDAENANGVTPLMFATKFGHAKVVALLIEQGADVNKKAKSGVSAMKIAREAKNQDIMDLLSAGGALD
jgi:hypothetical protein